MPIVYRAASIVDAQLVLDELKAAGLSVRISGSYLSGAIGEVPPGDLVTVWVDSERHKPCPKCKEMLAPQFGKCWNCGAWQTD